MDDDGAGRILVVCTGNIARSPYVERVLADGLSRSGPGAYDVGSAGVRAVVGSGMAPESARLLDEKGLTAAGFTARQLTRELVESADLVITATREHRGQVVALAPRALGRTFALLDLARLAQAEMDSRAVVTLPADDRPDRPGPLVASSRSLLRSVVARWAAHRVAVPPLPADQADLVDPIRGPREAFDAMAQRADEALEPILRGLLGPADSA